MLRKYTGKFSEKAAMDNYSDGLQARCLLLSIVLELFKLNNLFSFKVGLKIWKRNRNVSVPEHPPR